MTQTETKNEKLYTAALAGSAPRAPNQALDSALGQGLLTSPKEQNEHALVVEEILRRLVALGLQPEVTLETTILKLNGIQHLYTPIHSQLNLEVALLEAIDALEELEKGARELFDNQPRLRLHRSCLPNPDIEHHGY